MVPYRNARQGRAQTIADSGYLSMNASAWGVCKGGRNGIAGVMTTALPWPDMS
jgi:hypothetical protein